MTLSEQIKNCREGPFSNPFQGDDKKVVFVCSMGILRSATGARLYAHKYNTRSCGTWAEALIPLSENLLQWADEVVFVNAENYSNAISKFGLEQLNSIPSIRVLKIPDEYPHMHPKLVQAFKEQYEPI